MNEKVIRFGNAEHLVGVLSTPTKAPSSDQPMALILNAGIVHRSGPFRLHVDLARSLAAQGYASLRMDLSGLGDSDIRREIADGQDRATLDAKDAMNFLTTETGCNKFVLIGLCSGAYNAHQVAIDEDRIAGAVFLDGLVFRTEGFERRKRIHRMTHPRFWRNAVKRRLVKDALEKSDDDSPGGAEFFEVDRSAEEVGKEIRQMLKRDQQLLFVYTEGYDDISSRSQFQEMFDLQPNATDLQVEYYKNFEHTYRLSAHRQTVVDRVTDWYAERFPSRQTAMV